MYKSILLWVFQHGVRQAGTGYLLFSQTDLRQAAKELGLDVRNFPDLPYNLRSRSPLPQEIDEAGFTAIAIRGRGQYALVTGEDKVEIPSDAAVAQISTTRIPWAVRDILRPDEQGILSAMRYLDIVSDFMGVRCYHLQGHLRTSGRLVSRSRPTMFGLRILAKRSGRFFLSRPRGQGALGRHQMMSTIDAVIAKIPGFPVVPLAVQLQASGLLVLIQFDYKMSAQIMAISPKKFKGYQPHPKLPQWPWPGQRSRTTSSRRYSS